MSSPDRLRSLILAGPLLLLAGCGFAPVHGPSGGGAALRSTIILTEPATDLTFAFVRQFEERLGRAADPVWTLSYTIATAQTALAIDGSNNITRFNIEGTATWTLARTGSDAVVLSGRDATFTSYSATGSTVSTLESQRDAERRLAVILADRVVARLLGEAETLAR